MLFTLTFFPMHGVAMEANAICFDCFNPPRSSQDLNKPVCEISCMVNQCEQYFSSSNFSCNKYCASQTLFEKSAATIMKCAKGATWDVAKGIVMTPISIWNAMVDSIQRGNEFVDFCESNIACKRQLALEAAFLKSFEVKKGENGTEMCEPHSDNELKDVFTGDLIRKRTNVRIMAERDKKYQERLRKCHVPLPNLDTNEAPIDTIYAYAVKQVKDLGIRWECYDAADRAEMVCMAVGSILLPAGATKLAEQLAKFMPKPAGLVRKINRTLNKPKIDNIGLTLQGLSLHGSENGGLVARTIYQAEKKHGIKFVISDSEMFREFEHVREGQGFARGDDTIVFGSSFLKQPDYGLLLHEIKHISTTRKEIAARNIWVTFGDGSMAPNSSISEYYKKRYRFDEVEARISQAAGDGLSKNSTKSSTLRKAKAFIDDQKRVINLTLDWLKNHPDRGLNCGGICRIWIGKVKQVETPRYIYSTPDLGMDIPYRGPQNPSPMEGRAYVIDVLTERLKALEKLEQDRLRNK